MRAPRPGRDVPGVRPVALLRIPQLRNKLSAHRLALGVKTARERIVRAQTLVVDRVVYQRYVVVALVDSVRIVREEAVLAAQALAVHRNR